MEDKKIIKVKLEKDYNFSGNKITKINDLKEIHETIKYKGTPSKGIHKHSRLYKLAKKRKGVCKIVHAPNEPVNAAPFAKPQRKPEKEEE